MTAANFQQLLEFIARETGIALPESNYRQVKHFVSERLAALQTTLAGYLPLLKQSQEEYDRFLDVITVGETYFFREEKQFSVLEKLVFPQYQKNNPQRMMLWSAACSTGEEAVSLAALAEKFWGGLGEDRYQVLATDVNPYALKSFTAGTFRANSFREDGAGFHPLLQPFLQQRGNRWHLDARLRKKLYIAPFNLFQDDFERLSVRFHLVFLRNMLVYMPLGTRQTILNKLVQVMAEEGYLFLASSETPLLSHPHLKLCEHGGVYFFQKKNLRDKQQGIVFEPRLLKEFQTPDPAPRVQTPQPQPAASQAFNFQEILYCANQKLNNHLFTIKHNRNYTVALQLLQVVYDINAHRLSEARAVLAELKALAPPNEISLYLDGYIAMVAQQHDRAIAQFHKAVAQNPLFWPAQFYLGVLLHSHARKPQHARKAFAQCQQRISAYLGQNRYDYQFLLEGFNARYFLRMCQKWEERLSAQEE